MNIVTLFEVQSEKDGALLAVDVFLFFFSFVFLAAIAPPFLTFLYSAFSNTLKCRKFIQNSCPGHLRETIHVLISYTSQKQRKAGFWIHDECVNKSRLNFYSVFSGVSFYSVEREFFGLISMMTGRIIGRLAVCLKTYFATRSRMSARHSMFSYLR